MENCGICAFYHEGICILLGEHVDHHGDVCKEYIENSCSLEDIEDSYE